MARPERLLETAQWLFQPYGLRGYAAPDQNATFPLRQGLYGECLLSPYCHCIVDAVNSHYHRAYWGISTIERAKKVR